MATLVWWRVEGLDGYEMIRENGEVWGLKLICVAEYVATKKRYIEMKKATKYVGDPRTHNATADYGKMISLFQCV